MKFIPFKRTVRGGTYPEPLEGTRSGEFQCRYLLTLTRGGKEVAVRSLPSRAGQGEASSPVVSLESWAEEEGGRPGDLLTIKFRHLENDGWSREDQYLLGD